MAVNLNSGAGPSSSMSKSAKEIELLAAAAASNGNGNHIVGKKKVRLFHCDRIFSLLTFIGYLMLQ